MTASCCQCFLLGEISGVLKKFKELTVPELMNQKRTDGWGRVLSPSSLILLKSWCKDKKPAIIFGAVFSGKFFVANFDDFQRIIASYRKNNSKKIK